jgi:protoporphyrinogen oxidase
MASTPYDVLIVGAGLAGLHCALRIINKNPQLHVVIAEAYDYVGGRVESYTPPKFPNMQWESGAGRIHESHRMVKNYVTKYGLTLFPLPSAQDWLKQGEKPVPVPDSWAELSEVIDSATSSLEPSILATHTLKQILDATLGREKAEDLCIRFAYRAELETLRADLALKTFRNEMKTAANFYVVYEGLSALIKAMKEELESKKVKFLMNHKITKVSKTREGSMICTVQGGSIKANRVILALDSNSLKRVAPFQNYPTLKHLTMKPLLRTYGIFPFPPWFALMKKLVTDSPIRFMIPVNPILGSIMTSYTESQDADRWTNILEKRGEVTLKKEVMKELRQLFPETKIPDPLFFKAHSWKNGCTYWTPGMYDPSKESEKIMQPFPNQPLYICGESFSIHQTWMEGALIHADSMLKKFFL